MVLMAGLRMDQISRKGVVLLCSKFQNGCKNEKYST